MGVAHLSTSELERFCVGALSDDKMEASVIHMADCLACHQLFVQELRRQHGSGPFSFSLDLEFCFRHGHLDFNLLVAMADQALDPDVLDVINIHLTTCEICREDVYSFLDFRKRESY